MTAVGEAEEQVEVILDFGFWILAWGQVILNFGLSPFSYPLSPLVGTTPLSPFPIP